MNLSPNPINRETLNLFSGRVDTISKIKKHLKLFDVILLEGEYGVGKTSIGNYIRFSNEKVITPEIEISTDIEWSIQDFINTVLKNLLDSIESNPKFSSFLYLDLVKKLQKRYQIIEDQYTEGGIAGVSFGRGSTTSRTNILTQSELIKDLKSLVSVCKKSTGENVIVQLNNLDLMNNEKEIIKFFSVVRNVFQTEHLSWILTGSEGLGSLLQRKLSKMGDLISIIKIGQLDADSTISTFNKRLDITLDEVFLRTLYRLCDAKYRTLNNYVKNYILGEDYSEFLGKIKQSEILELIKEKDYNQKELKLALTISAGKISKDLKKLVNLRYLNEYKRNRTIYYRISPEFFINKKSKG